MREWFSEHIMSLLIVIIGILTPAIPLILTVGFLVAADFMFALYKAYKLNEPITSRKMGNTISKMVLYTVAILSVFFLEVYVLDKVLPISKIAAGLICLVEFKSLDESFKKLFNWSLWEKMKTILDRGNSSTKDIMKDL